MPTRQSNFTPYLVSQPAGGPAALDVYVDPVLGSDLNPGTAALPLATVAAVYVKYPLAAFSRATVTVHLVGDGATLIDFPVSTLIVNGGDAAENLYRYRGPQMILATLATGAATVVGGLTPAVSDRRTTITVAPNPGWTVSDLQGHYLRVTRAGLKVVFEIPICANTANVITVDDEKLSPLIQAGDTIEIVTWGARFVSTEATLQILITGNAGYIPTPMFWGPTDPSSTFERVYFDDYPLAMQVGGLTFDRCGMNNFPFFKGGSIGHINCIYTLGFKTASMSVEFGIAGRPDSVTDPIDTTVAMELLVLPAGLLLIGNPDGVGQYMAKRNVSIYAGGSATRGAIHVVGMGSMFWADDGTLAPNGAVALGGSGNLGPYIWAIHGGQVRVNTTAGASPPTYGTGTGSPLRVGKGAAVAYGTAAGAYEEAAGFNGNFHRMFAGTVTAPTGDASRIFTPQ